MHVTYGFFLLMNAPRRAVASHGYPTDYNRFPSLLVTDCVQASYSFFAFNPITIKPKSHSRRKTKCSRTANPRGIVFHSVTHTIDHRIVQLDVQKRGRLASAELLRFAPPFLDGVKSKSTTG